MGRVDLCEESLPIPTRICKYCVSYLAKKEKKEQPKKEEKPKEEKKKEQPMEEPKPAKPAKNPLDLLPPTPLDLDNWKRVYSNTHSDFYSVMDKFWAMYDIEGWSLWICDYKYNDENKKGFMTANLVSGFIQRSDSLRKYSFGNMSILKGEEPYYCVKGAWLIRGKSIQPMLDENPDAECYTWTKVDENSEADKKELADLWCASETIDGKEINSNEVFK
jgi:elongation factor 1-gamma